MIGRYSRRNGGFTLIETMVSIGLIGVVIVVGISSGFILHMRSLEKIKTVEAEEAYVTRILQDTRSMPPEKSQLPYVMKWQEKIGGRQYTVTRGIYESESAMDYTVMEVVVSLERTGNPFTATYSELIIAK